MSQLFLNLSSSCHSEVWRMGNEEIWGSLLFAAVEHHKESIWCHLQTVIRLIPGPASSEFNPRHFRMEFIQQCFTVTFAGYLHSSCSVQYVMVNSWTWHSSLCKRNSTSMHQLFVGRHRIIGCINTLTRKDTRRTLAGSIIIWCKVNWNTNPLLAAAEKFCTGGVGLLVQVA